MRTPFIAGVLAASALAAPAAWGQDSTAPRIASITRQTPASSPTNADSLTWRVTFNEDVSYTPPGADLTLTDNVADDLTFALGGASWVATAVVDSTTYVFVTGSNDNGVSVFSAASDGTLTHIETVADDGTLLLDGAHSAVTAVLAGTTYLFVAGTTDDGVSVFSVANDGTLTNVDNVADDGTLLLNGARALHIADIAGTTYLFVASLTDSGVSVFSVANDGTLTNVENVADDATLELAFSRSLETAVVAGTTYLFVAGTSDDGVSVFSVANDGTLTNVENIADGPGLALDGPHDLSAITIDGRTYLYVAVYNDDRVHIFSVATNGSLSLLGTVVDDATLELEGVIAVTPAVINNQTYLLASGYLDEGLSLFSVANDGTLTNVDNVAGDATLELFGAANAAALSVGDTPYLFVPVQIDDGVRVFSIASDGAASGNFAVAGTTATATETRVSSSIIDVTASGGDLATLDGTVTLSLSGTHDFADIAGNALTNAVPTGTNNNTFVLDRTGPRVSSIERETDEVILFQPRWTVRFNENVANLDASDFTVDGIPGSMVEIDSGANFIEMQSTPAAFNQLSGTATLAFAAGQDVTDTFGNALTNLTPTGTNQNTTIIDRTAPTVVVDIVDSALSDADNTSIVTFEFSEPVSGFSISDATAVGGSMSLFNVVDQDSYSATFTADDNSTTQGSVTVGAGSYIDAVGNGGASGTDTVTVDTANPTVAITGPSGPVGGPFTATFTYSESVTGLALGEITVGNGAASNLSGSGTTYTATITPDGDGTVTVNVGAGVAIDAAGNLNTAASQFSVTADATAPLVASIERQSPASSPTNANSVTWRILFSETVQNVDVSDFTVSGTTGGVTNVTNSSGNFWDVTVTGGDMGGLDGTITLNFAGGQNIADAAGNSLTNTTPYGIFQNTYVLDISAPFITAFARNTPAGEKTNADTLVYDITFSEIVTSVSADDFTITGTTATGVLAGSGSAYTLTLSGGDLASYNGIAGINLAGGQDIADLAGNALPDAEPGTDETYDVRNLAPALASITRSSPAGSPTNADSLVWDLSFAAIDGAFTLPANAFTVAGTTATVTDVSRYSIGLYVTVSGGDLAGLNGDVTIGLANSDFADDYGNVMDRTIPPGAELTYSVDNSGPSVTSIARYRPLDAQPLNGGFVTWRVTFSEGVANVDASDFTIAGTTGTLSVAAVPNSNAAFDVSVSGGDMAGLSGLVTLSVSGANDITDPGGNPLTGTAPTGTNDNTMTLRPGFNAAGGETLVNTTTASDQDDPRVVPLSDGSFVIVFGDDSADAGVGSAGVDIRGQRYSAAGAAVGGEFLVNSTTLDFQGNVQTSELRDGGWVAVYEDDSFEGADSSVVGVRARIFDNASAPAGADFEVHTTTLGPQYDADVAGLIDTGGFVVVWSDDSETGDDTSGTAIRGQIFEADGTPVGGEFVANTTTFDDQDTPSVVGLQGGGFAVIFDDWSETGDDLSEWAVRARIFSSAGIPAGADFVVNTTTTDSQIFSRAAALRDGGFVVVYEDDSTENGDADDAIMGQVFDGDGTRRGSEFRVNTTLTGDQGDAEVAGLAGGGFIVTWVDPSETGGDLSQDAVRAQRYLADGTADGAEFQANTTTPDDQDDPSVAGLAGGGFVIVWEDSSQAAGDGNGDAVLFQRYEADLAAPVLTAFTRSIPSDATTNSDTLVFAIAFNEAVANVSVGDFTITGTTATGVLAGSGAAYTLTLSGGDLAGFNGSVGLDLGAGQNITDLSGNALGAGEPATDQSYLLDNTAPAATVFSRLTPAGERTNADTLIWRVTFSELVGGVDPADFAVTGTTATVTSVDAVAAGDLPEVSGAPGMPAPLPTSATFDVTVSGGDLAGYSGFAGLDLAAAPVITDPAGNALTTSEPATDERYDVRNIPAALASIARLTPPTSPTNADSLTWQLTFAQIDPYLTLPAGAFTVAGTTATVTDVSRFSIGFYVTVSGGDLANLEGDVTLGLTDSDYTDDYGNVMDRTIPAGAELVYTVENTPPSVVSILRQQPTDAVTNADTLRWRVTFDEMVTNFDASDFTVAGTTATVTAVSNPSFNSWDVLVSGGDLASVNGLVTLAFSGSQNITDLAGNGLASIVPTGANQASFTLDNAAPTLASILRLDPASQTTNQDYLRWQFTFSEAITNLTPDDFLPSGTTATVTSVVPVGATFPAGAGLDSSFAVTATVWYVTIAGGDLASLNGSVSLGLDPAQDIADAAGNPLSSTVPTGGNESYTLDNIAPNLVSVTRLDPASATTNQDYLRWQVTFSEGVRNLTPGDFAATGTTAAVNSIIPLAAGAPPLATGSDTGIYRPFAVSETVFYVTLAGGDLATLNGAVALGLSAGNDIIDAGGNVLANLVPTGANEGYTLDNAAPTVAITSSATAPVSGPFPITITFSEDVTGFDVSDLAVGNGTASGFASTDARTFTATITPGVSGTVTVDVANGAAQDGAGNDTVAAAQFSIDYDGLRTLTVDFSGLGGGRIVSDPAGLDCTDDCSAPLEGGRSYELSAEPDAESVFVLWTEGPCSGSSDAVCTVELSADVSVGALFQLASPPQARIMTATLPGARSGYVGGPEFSAFLSVSNGQDAPAQNCYVSNPTDSPVALTSARLDGSGDPTGSINPYFDLEPGASANFVLGMTPNTPTDASGYTLFPLVTCQNASFIAIPGVNSILLSIGNAPSPDVLSTSATPSGDGVIRIAEAGRAQVMTAAALNIGGGDGSAGPDEVTLTASVDTGATALPVSLEICQINSSAACITPRGPTVTSVVQQNVAVFYAVFVRDTSGGAGIPFDPVNARVYLRFADAGDIVRSVTSAAVTVSSAEDRPVTSAMPEGRWSVLMRRSDDGWPAHVRAAVHVAENGVAVIDDGAAPRLVLFDPVPELSGGDPMTGFFRHDGTDGRWNSRGVIRLGAPWADQPGEFWGVRDARTGSDVQWLDLAGSFGGSVQILDTGEIRGVAGGCAVYGQSSGAASSITALTLTGCSLSGSYAAVVDLPANDNEAPVLVIAGRSAGWRLAQ